VPGVARTEIMRERDACAAGLIAGTVPTNGRSGCAARNGGKTRVDAVLQAITTRSGACAAIHSSSAP
jgi:hypothetical protein